jgi:putative glycosyltransferase (TIGR04348 family)
MAGDVLIALHARRSYPAIRRFLQQSRPGAVVLALTGTDVYRDMKRSARAREALALADRIVVLQPRACDELPAAQRAKARVVWQSVPDPGPMRRAARRGFVVCVLAHLRREKDPLRAAAALRFLPELTELRVVHGGAALDASFEQRARRLMARDRRYVWLGEMSRPRALRLLVGSDLLVVSSRMEGGANVVSEAIVYGIPVLASEIPGNVGMLGEGYPGYYPLGDTRALADLIRRAQANGHFHDRLRRWCANLRPRFSPERERDAWKRLLEEIVSGQRRA